MAQLPIFSHNEIAGIMSSCTLSSILTPHSHIYLPLSSNKSFVSSFPPTLSILVSVSYLLLVLVQALGTLSRVIDDVGVFNVRCSVSYVSGLCLDLGFGMG